MRRTSVANGIRSRGRTQPGPSTERRGGYAAAALKISELPKPPAVATVRESSLSEDLVDDPDDV